ncbi:beta strand repeat-containing protein, partial [Deinococcus yavapaiensis]
TATPPNVTVGNQSLTQGQSANFNVTASDPQDLALTYSLAQGSSLPTGLSLNSSTGVVSGTPTVFGTFPVTFQVTNSGGGVTNKTVTLTVTATAPSLTVGNQSLTQGQSANFNVTATDPQNLALTYSLAQGSTLPAGLSLNSSTGIVSGTPSVFGTFPVAFQVTNSGGASATKTITLTITATAPSLTVGNQTLMQGQSANFNVTASDPQNLALTYSLAQGSTLPAGLSLNSSTGVVSGTPSTAGTTNVTFQVTNSGGGTASKTAGIVVIAPPSITVGNQILAQGQSGNFTVTASDPQNLTLTYSLASGSTLPAGLSLNASTGVVSGVPTGHGAFPVTFQVTNSSGASATKTITITITATPPNITVGNQTLMQGQSANFNVTASDPQNLALTYSLAAGSTLPAGLSLNGSTGVVSGTPTTAGTTSVTFTVTNSGGGTASKTIILTVNSTSGLLDTTFGTGGKVTTAMSVYYDEVRALAVQADGKIVAAGYINNGTNLDLALTRFSVNGTLDTTFGSGGKVITAIGSSDDLALALVVQSDGKIVAAGRTFNGSNDDFLLVRYTASGTLDSTFGTGGKVTTDFGSSSDGIFALMVQSDGKLIAAGFATNGSNYDFALARYEVNGALDTTFNGIGKIATPIGASDDIAFALALQSSGKIVAAGRAFNGTNDDFALVRYNSNGSLDTTFGSGGKVTTPVGTSQDYANALVVQPDGKLVAAGYAFNGSNDDFALVRYTTSGSLDTTFGSSGKVTTGFGSGSDTALALALQPDGKLVAAGLTSNGSNNDFALARYTTSGSLDTTFGSSGKVTTAIGSGNDGALALALQPDGKLVAAGYTLNSSTSYDFALARYLP